MQSLKDKEGRTICSITLNPPYVSYCMYTKGYDPESNGVSSVEDTEELPCEICPFAEVYSTKGSCFAFMQSKGGWLIPYKDVFLQVNKQLANQLDLQSKEGFDLGKGNRELKIEKPYKYLAFDVSFDGYLDELVNIQDDKDLENFEKALGIEDFSLNEDGEPYNGIAIYKLYKIIQLDIIPDINEFYVQ